MCLGNYHRSCCELWMQKSPSHCCWLWKCQLNRSHGLFFFFFTLCKGHWKQMEKCFGGWYFTGGSDSLVRAGFVIIRCLTKDNSSGTIAHSQPICKVMRPCEAATSFSCNNHEMEGEGRCAAFTLTHGGFLACSCFNPFSWDIEGLRQERNSIQVCSCDLAAHSVCFCVVCR